MKAGWSDRSISNNQFSSVTLNELAGKARESSSFNKAVNPMTDININEARTATFCVKYMSLNL